MKYILFFSSSFVDHFQWVEGLYFDEWRSNTYYFLIMNRTSKAMIDNLSLVMVLYLFIHCYLWLDNQGGCCYLQQRFPNCYLCLSFWYCVICRMNWWWLLKISAGLLFLNCKKKLPKTTLYYFCIFIIHSLSNCKKDLLNAVIRILLPKLSISFSITFKTLMNLNAVNFSISFKLNVKLI